MYAKEVFGLTMQDARFARLFEKPTILVPVPGSAPSLAPWAAERLAFALHSVGLGNGLWAGIRRIFPVRKSATALTADRPSVQQHYDSFAVTLPERSNAVKGTPPRFVLVDDVITKGRTLFAAGVRLQEAFPHADIRAFALVRTMGFLPNLNHLSEPCEGVIRWCGGDARREP
jgi:hypothetical protein